jgi:Zn-dependent peptidase ImmA (M78 family)
MRVTVSPGVLAWARERSGAEAGDLERRFPNLAGWESGEGSPTLKQLESFARATHTPIGFLFLDEPPDERVPIPDYRTMGRAGVGRPSADLLDTIFLCQLRQEWYREFALVTGEGQVDFVGTLNPSTPVPEAAANIRTALRFDTDERGQNWSEALRLLVDRAEEAGALVMTSGVVGSNTHRKLDPHEFRGFALVDSVAPLVFVNGADTKAAQLFTLMHELAHLWLGGAALDDAGPAAPPSTSIERWCNEVAAEVLVPLDVVRAEFDAGQPLSSELERLARNFKASTLVVLRRLYDAHFLGNWDAYRSAYEAELHRVLEILAERAGGGGNFYSTQPVRVSKRFTRAVITSTLEGQTLYTDAFQMLGFRSAATFQQLADHLGVA